MSCNSIATRHGSGIIFFRLCVVIAYVAMFLILCKIQAAIHAFDMYVHIIFFADPKAFKTCSGPKEPGFFFSVFFRTFLRHRQK